MATRSKRITFDVNKSELNKESVDLLKKYKSHMTIKELSEKTIYNYECDLYAWFSYIKIFQNNKSVLEIDEDDLSEYFYYRKTNGNNSRRIRGVMASISAFYIHLKKNMLNHKSTDVTLKHYIKEDNSKLKEAKKKFGALRNMS